MTAKQIEILLVEDSPGDVELVKQGLRKGRVANNLHVAQDGVEAMKFLSNDDNDPDCPRPDLVLLDINLPRKTGHEVLADIRSSPELRAIPVIVLTTSDQDDDVLKAYEHHANAYVTKPLAGPEFLDVVAKIQGFWLSVVKLPSKADV